MNVIQKIALTFTIIGAINWGLVGIFNFNLVDYIFGVNSIMSRIIYTVVAIAGLINIVIYFIDLDTPKVIKEKVDFSTLLISYYQFHLIFSYLL